MILGQIVAISFASALFLASLANLPRAGMVKSSSFLNWSVALAFLTVAIVPNTVEDKTFLPNLLVMHILITMPLFGLSDTTTSNGASKAPQSSSSFKRVYWTIALISAAMHVKHSIPALATSNYSLERFAQQIWPVVNSYPAQSSISWDVFCTNLIWQLWSTIEIWNFRNQIGLLESLKALSCIAVVPTFGSASAIAAFLALREDWIAKEKGHVIDKRA